ncbi:MAG: response regulator [Burkholderiales bacterium]
MNNPTILIVEDESVVALDMALQLRDLGYDVCGTATSGVQALELTQQHAPDLILMDVRLQGEVDGIEAARQIQRECPAPVIFLTSHSDNFTVSRAAATAPYGYLTKPFQLKELRASIEVALAKAAQEKQAQQVLQQQAQTQISMQTQAEKAEFLARASHELRTPLNAVIGFAQLLQSQLALDPSKAKVYATHIRDAGDKLLNMVNDLLDVQAAEGGDISLTPQAVNVLPLLRETQALLDPLAAQQGVVLQLEVGAGVAVHADPSRLLQVLLNLGSNAIKFNHRGGQVFFRAARDNAAVVTLMVEDTGMGMTAQQQERLFQPFDRLGRERSPVPGTGLGLLTAQRLVASMGGRLFVVSARGSGTTVAVELPAADGLA